MKQQTYFLFSFLALVLLVSCSPSFHLKKNQKLDAITLKVEYGSEITPEQVNIIQLNLNQFVAEFNQEKPPLSRTSRP